MYICIYIYNFAAGQPARWARRGLFFHGVEPFMNFTFGMFLYYRKVRIDPEIVLVFGFETF